MNWQSIRGLEWNDFNESEAVIHHLAQFLAMFGKNYVPQQDDDSNANLNWNPDLARLQSREIKAGGRTLILQLDIVGFCLEFAESNGRVLARIEADHKTKDLIRLECQSQMEDLHIDPEKYSFIDHYDVPEHPVDLGEPFSRPPDDHLQEWIKQRTDAEIALEYCNTKVGIDSEIRVWPHHFDTGTYYPFGETKAIGAGWAIGDSMVNTPYLYIYPWKKDREIDFTNSPDLEHGEFLSGLWKGAVLSAGDLSSSPGQEKDTRKFILTVIDYFKGILGV